MGVVSSAWRKPARSVRSLTYAASATAKCQAYSNNELSMDATNSGGDIEPCFASGAANITSVDGPVALWPATDGLDGPLPAGSTVTVDLYVTAENSTVVQPTGVLIAADREFGARQGAITAVA